MPFTKSIDVSNSVNWRVFVVVPIPAETDGTLVCTKNLLKELVRFINPSLAALFVAFLNKLFILSICRTLFVEHSKKFDSSLVSKETNLDRNGFDKVSTSFAKSKLSIASTLFSDDKSLIIVDESTLDVVLIPDEVEIPRSAKFLRPVVCNNLFTGLTNVW